MLKLINVSVIISFSSSFFDTNKTSNIRILIFLFFSIMKFFKIAVITYSMMTIPKKLLDGYVHMLKANHASIITS